MAFNRPTIATLIARFKADSESALDSAFGWLRRGLLPSIGKAQVGLAHGLYGNIDYVSKQIVPGFATDPIIIERQAQFYLSQGRKLATNAIGPIIIQGNEGAALPNGRIFKRAGIEYKTQAEAIIVNGTATVQVQALTGGQETNADTATKLKLTEPTDGIRATATVATPGLTGGTDDETWEQVNARIRHRRQRRPNGSNEDQYEVWALEVPGVTRAWVFSNWNGLGTVGLYFVRDDDPVIFPDVEDIQTVKQYIDQRRPAGMKSFSAYSPTSQATDFVIAISPNNSETQAAVKTSIKEIFRREASVGDGQGSGTILLSHIREAISTSAGERDHQIVSPTQNITVGRGGLAMLGEITWQSL